MGMYDRSYGNKYDASLSTVEIAKRIRADVKALAISGLKVSVRSRTKGTSAIDIEIKALPEDMNVYNESYTSYRKQFPDTNADVRFDFNSRFTQEYLALFETINSIHSAYNHDGSNYMTDYFDVNYYGNVSLDWRVRRDIEAAEVEASPGTYWAKSEVA